MRNFRLLEASEIECRVARCSDKGVQLLLYKTARTDYAVLDEVVGMWNWQNDYKEVDGKVYCGIGIKFEDKWVWKWNCGAESNMEAEKGEASDAMKRAGFAWGIGTELYSSPFVWVKAENCKIVGGKCFDRFVVREIGYDENERINRLEIDNESMHCQAFSFGTKVKRTKEDRDVMIATCITLAKKVGGEKLINEQGYNGKPWDELTDEQVVQAKLWLVERGKNAGK